MSLNAYSTDDDNDDYNNVIFTARPPSPLLETLLVIVIHYGRWTNKKAVFLSLGIGFQFYRFSTVNDNRANNEFQHISRTQSKQGK